MSLNTTQISINDDSIVVPSSGAYFLYSRVVINAKLGNNLKDTDMITHTIRYSNTGYQFKDLETSSIKCGVIKDTMTHISYIEKIQYLEKGSFIKIALDFPRDASMQPSISAGAFGMFKLWTEPSWYDCHHCQVYYIHLCSCKSGLPPGEYRDPFQITVF